MRVYYRVYVIKNIKYIKLNSNTILQLHRDLYKFIGLRLNRQGMFNEESLNKL